MAIAQLSSRNQANVLPEISITDRIVLQPHTWYICPTGKKAIVKARIQCTGRGAAATATMRAAGVNMFTWVAGAAIAGTDPYREVPNNIGISNFPISYEFIIPLSAGEQLETIQSSGTNAEFNLWGNVLELPA